MLPLNEDNETEVPAYKGKVGIESW